MRYLQNENDTLVFKTGDTSETIRLSARNDNQPITFVDGDTATVHVDKDNAHIKTIDAVLVSGSNNITFSTSELSDLPAAQYQLEVWIKLASDGSQAIYPSEGMLSFTIDRNADSLEGGAITTITLDTFKDQLNKAIEEAKKQATPGKSAYQLWLDEGNKGTEQDFLASLKGEKGDQGATGETGQAGQPGLSAYQLAVKAGFKGSETEWLDYLRKGPQGPQGEPGKDGKDGQSAYQIWINNGHEGTETDFLNSLIGQRGEQGPQGEPGKNGQDGERGPQGQPGQNGKDGATPSLKFGTITSVAPDQPAEAELIDNKDNSYTLNLTLPRGAKGETGGINQVVKPELTIGTVTTVNSDDQASASLTKTSETGYAIDLNIPAGKAGEQGPQGEPGKAGADGKNGADGQPGKDGKDGKSAYDLAVENGFKGDLKAWLDSLKGQPGKDATGKPGADGKSAYQIWLDAGNKGTEQDFLNSLKGAAGVPGKDAVGKDGRRGSAIFTTSDYINPDVNPVTASVASLKSSDSTLKPMTGDYVIATVNGDTQILEITSVNADTVQFSSDKINIQGSIGPQGAQGHSIWLVDIPFMESGSFPVDSLIGYNSYGNQPQLNDVLISKDGDISTIDSFDYGSNDPMTGKPTIDHVNVGQILGHFGGQSDEPTNANFDYDKLPKLTIVDQNKLGDYLGLDSSKSYTLDVDDFTLNDGTKETKKFLKPGIYLLRDIANHGYNLTIKSTSNMAGTYANPVQLIVTPYTIVATAAEGSTASWFIRTDWSHDSMDYWGINNGWTKLAEGPKSVNN